MLVNGTLRARVGTKWSAGGRLGRKWDDWESSGARTPINNMGHYAASLCRLAALPDCPRFPSNSIQLEGDVVSGR